MARHSDQSLSAAEIAASQARRLGLLRQALGLPQVEAARIAGVTRDAWGRYERGDSRIDAVSLARFLGAVALAGGYVITGNFDGMPAELVRDLIRAEAEAAETDSEARRD